MATLNAIANVRPLPALSPEVRNILDEPPIWLVRWGSMLLLGAILLLLLSAGFVRYPRTITGQAIIYASTQLTAIELPAGTMDYSLRVHSQQVVVEGQLLATIRQGGVERAITAPTAGTIIVPAKPSERVLVQLLPTAQAKRSIVTLAAKLGRRVRVGQLVLISLNAFPSDKFGQLPGHIMNVAQSADASQVTATIALDQGYQSTHGIRLHVAGVNHGMAQVIIADKRLLSSMLNSRF